MTPLPRVDEGRVTCEGCGVCCTYVGAPPGHFAAFASPDWDGWWLADTDDHVIWRAMPQALRDELRAFYATEEGRRRSGSRLPCIWYDGAARRCLHHAHRPQVCRDFEVGGPGCLTA